MTKALTRVSIGLLALLLAVPVALLALAAAALQSEPAVALEQAVDHNDVGRALALARANDPRLTTAGTVQAALLSERDLNVLLNHGAQRWLGASGLRAQVQHGSATLQASAHVPASPVGRWLNVQLRLAATGGLPVIDALRIGRVPVPAWLARRLWLPMAKRAGVLGEVKLAFDLIQRVDFLPQQLRVVYAWRDDSADRMVAALLPADEQARLRAYSDRLAALSHTVGSGWQLSLAALLGPVFTLAQQRTAAGGDAAAENRAAIVMLTLYANGRGLDSVLPAARSWPRPRPLRLLLAGREDFPLHLLVSAAVVVEGTGPLSKAIGIYKEVADARGGSGFSFNDIAADRAGTRLGELAVQQPQRLQALLARGVQEADFMPAVADLPEFMTEADFQRRYGGISAPAYQAMLAEIDRRVAALPALR